MSNADPRDELLALRELFRAYDPAPDSANAAACAARVSARGLRTNAMPLTLLSDSAAETAPLLRESGLWPGARALTFGVREYLIDFDVLPSAPQTLTASGLVLCRSGQPLPYGSLTFRYPDDEVHSELDPFGRFTAEQIPAGPVSVVFHTRRGVPAVADWVVW